MEGAGIRWGEHPLTVVIVGHLRRAEIEIVNGQLVVINNTRRLKDSSGKGEADWQWIWMQIALPGARVRPDEKVADRINVNVMEL